MSEGLMSGNLRHVRQARRAMLPLCVPGATAVSGAPALPPAAYWAPWACEQGVAALLYSRLGGQPLEPVTETMLRRFSWDCAIEHQQAAEAVSRLAEKTRQAGLEILFLKGVPLAQRYYPCPEQRPVRDVDALVHERDLGHLESLLGSLGYVPARRDASELAFESSVRLPPVELHWRLVNSGSLRANLPAQEEDLWRRAATVPVNGVCVSIPGDWDAFRHGCIHAAQHHQFSRLIWLIDLLQIARKGTAGPDFRPPWTSRLTSDGERLAVGAALHLLADLFPGMVPADGAELLPRRRWTAFLFHRLTAKALLTPESTSIKYRRKLFREALKRHG
jgi:hypothetical protein